MTLEYSKPIVTTVAMNDHPSLHEANEIRRADIIRFHDESSVIVGGPIAEQITQGLQEIYAKDKDPSTGIILESQAIDAAIEANVVKSLFGSELVKDERQGVLYGIKREEISHSEIIDLADAITDLTPEQKANSAVIMTGNAPVTYPVSSLSSATGSVSSEQAGEVTMEAYTERHPYANSIVRICKRNNVTVYRSADDYVKAKKAQAK